MVDHIEHASQFVAPLDHLAGLRAPRTGDGVEPARPGDGVEPARPGDGVEPARPVDGDGPPLRFVDMGAGGGLPSLPILVVRPTWNAVLLDASQKRCSFLVWAVAELGLADRVDVWCGRAEEIGHEERARFQFDAVVARGFGPPPSTVECGAALLRPGGVLVISEPPQGRAWPAEPLAEVGMVQRMVVDGDVTNGVSAWPGVVLLERVGDVAPSYPRRAKIQQRTPLF